jgi:hypothetical protein
MAEYSEGEKIFAYHQGMIYEAKVSTAVKING